MVGWHHRLNGHESEQALGVGDGQGGLVCCSPRGLRELDTTEQLNNNSHCGAHASCGSQALERRLSSCGTQA